MHNYANFCIIMHDTGTKLLRSLPIIMTKVCVKFHPDLISSFEVKVEEMKGRTNKGKRYIDSLLLEFLNRTLLIFNLVTDQFQILVLTKIGHL